jgi:hypothetical protein
MIRRPHTALALLTEAFGMFAVAPAATSKKHGDLDTAAVALGPALWVLARGRRRAASEAHPARQGGAGGGVRHPILGQPVDTPPTWMKTRPYNPNTRGDGRVHAPSACVATWM